MELRHLRYFIAVADRKGFSHAARHLYVSQSAISEQVADLEREAGVQLLRRNRRQVELTQAGKIFLDEARKVIAAAEQAMQSAQRSVRGEIGTLRIGFFTNGMDASFPSMIRAFRTHYPAVRLSLIEMADAEMGEALADNIVDIALMRPVEEPYKSVLQSQPLFKESLVAVLPKNHPLAKPHIRLSTIAQEPIVLIERAVWPTLFDSIIALCARSGFSPKIANTAARWPAVLTLVEAGEGIGLVTAGVRRYRFSNLVYCELTPTTSAGVVLAWRKDHSSEILRGFLNLVRDKRKVS
jgi:DNA-binding transcriptional LysR family regulator